MVLTLRINGASAELPEGSTLNDMIETLELAERRLAIELNLEIVPRSQYDQVRLLNGDRIEIVQAVGGG